MARAKVHNVLKQHYWDLLLVLTVVISAGLSSLALRWSNAAMKLEATTSERREPASIHLAVDSARVNRCPAANPSYSQLPCLKSSVFLAKNNELGPVVCQDECDWEQDCGQLENLPTRRLPRQRRCLDNRDTFEVTNGSNSVRLLKDGVYRVYAQVSFINTHGSAATTALQAGRSHIWLQCHQGGGSAPNATKSPAVVCSMASQRRFRSGQMVSIHLADAFLEVDCSPRATFWGLVRLSD